MLVQNTVDALHSDPCLRAEAEEFYDIRNCMIKLRGGVEIGGRLIADIDDYVSRLAKAYDAWRRMIYLCVDKEFVEQNAMEFHTIITTLQKDGGSISGLISRLELLAEMHE
jgi:hypothetical protein